MPKIPQKISYKCLLRENAQLKKKLQEASQGQMNSFNTMFITAINLYDENPNHDMFVGGFFKEEFLQQIKEAWAKRKEAAAKLEADKKKAAEASSKPGDGSVPEKS